MKLKKHVFLLAVGLLTAALYAQNASEEASDLSLVEAPVEETASEEIKEEGDAVSLPVTESEEIYEEKQEEDNGDIYIDANKSKKKSGGLGESITSFFKMGNDTFVEYDVLTFSTLTALNNTKKTEAVFVGIKDNDLYGFGSPYSAGYYYVFFDSKTRKQLIDAGNQYLKDFAEKKLQRKGKKTTKKYGKATTDVYFGSMKIQAKNHSQPFTYFGYNFKKDSPYFTITCNGAPNLRFKDKDDPYPEESNVVAYYFTKAQLSALMELLSDENLNNYKLQVMDNFIPSDPDSY